MGVEDVKSVSCVFAEILADGAVFSADGVKGIFHVVTLLGEKAEGVCFLILCCVVHVESFVFEGGFSRFHSNEGLPRFFVRKKNKNTLRLRHGESRVFFTKGFRSGSTDDAGRASLLHPVLTAVAERYCPHCVVVCAGGGILAGDRAGGCGAPPQPHARALACAGLPTP